MNYSSSSTITACYGGGDMAITGVHPDIIQEHILTKLDGPTLASTSCTSSELNNICSDETLWKNICTSNWPSTTDPRIQHLISTFSSGHRSFFSDSYPTVRRLRQKQPQILLCNRLKSSWSPQPETVPTRELVSAVDVHYGDQIIYSKVVVTETLTSWFMCSPLRIELLDTMEIVPTPVKFDGNEETCKAKVEKELRLSWIIIDPLKKRAVNLSSLMPVDVRRQWITGEMLVRYSTVMAAGIAGGFLKFGVDVTCGGKEGGDLHVREISMQVEDMEGRVLIGRECLGILRGMMGGKRVNREIEEEKKMHEKFLEMRLIWRERRQRRERMLDMVCIVTGFTIIMAFWMFIFYR